MLNQEDITNLKRRLDAHRQTLGIHLEQLARLGSSFAHPGVIHGIREARQGINHIKQTLRGMEIEVEDHPDDDDDSLNILDNKNRHDIKSQEEVVFENPHSQFSVDILSETPSLLIGILIDVSRSVLDTIEMSSSKSNTSRAKVDRSINIIIEKFTLFGATPESKDVLSRFRLFLYGYGFGNLRNSANKILNTLGIRSTKNSQESISSQLIRDLFAEISTREEIPSTPLGSELNKFRDLYQKSIEAQLLDVGLGSSILLQGIETVHERFKQESKSNQYENLLLIIISDGNIKEEDTIEVRQKVEALQKQGVQIVSGYVGKTNLVRSRVFYSQPKPNWTPDAIRLFDFASPSTTSNPVIVRILDLAREHNWQVPDQAKAFVQVNQTRLIEELIDFILDAIRD